ncbi:hypothetical protein K1T73_05545 [Roseovarius sp. SCSIO 43702]|uniref:hypothetical protein n=1 Tax=Roseovarius sp. SCSIO 43702 TaxID=2823043 RepID=UPI001C72C6A6|nr:hypothetical protein [Roseovarius sp. SCSIO 43702]QYX57853.1 hypothetical protein K1T73_05545 [Roseovarius sp. SCSIO 43702]
MSRVAVLPYGMKLGARPGRLPLAALQWPLGLPEDAAGATLGDLGPDDHLLVFPRGSHFWRPGFGTRARVSLLVCEPQAIQGRIMARLKRAHGRFHRVLSANEALLEAIPNGIFWPFGSTWVPEWRDLDLEKRALCSLIASAKRSQEGHRLRHEIVDRAREADFDLTAMGGGYAPFRAKAEGLAPFRYSVVIENVRERNYFTEKIVDAVLCETVPIYWGCPNIAEFFDTDGWIVCDTAEDIMAALAGMSEADSEARRPAIAAQKERAAHWGDFTARAARAVLET